MHLRVVHLCVVYPPCNSRLHRFINARNTTLALTHASLNRAGKSRWNAERTRWKLGGGKPAKGNARVAHSGVAWHGVARNRSERHFFKEDKSSRVAIESTTASIYSGNCAVAIKDDLSIGEEITFVGDRIGTDPPVVGCRKKKEEKKGGEEERKRIPLRTASLRLQLRRSSRATKPQPQSGLYCH